jgi:hypothetical protein
MLIILGVTLADEKSRPIPETLYAMSASSRSA